MPSLQELIQTIDRLGSSSTTKSSRSAGAIDNPDPVDLDALLAAAPERITSQTTGSPWLGSPSTTKSTRVAGSIDTPTPVDLDALLESTPMKTDSQTKTIWSEWLKKSLPQDWVNAFGDRNLRPIIGDRATDVMSTLGGGMTGQLAAGGAGAGLAGLLNIGNPGAALGRIGGAGLGAAAGSYAAANPILNSMIGGKIPDSYRGVAGLLGGLGGGLLGYGAGGILDKLNRSRKPEEELHYG